MEGRNSGDALDSFFHTIELIGGILCLSVVEGFVLQRWREVEFWVIAPNFGAIAVLLVVMWRRYIRYLRAYMSESRAQNPSARWYQRLRYKPKAGKQDIGWGSLVLGCILALTWIAILIARGR